MKDVRRAEMAERNHGVVVNNRVCMVEGCAAPTLRARGAASYYRMCNKHRMRWKRTKRVTDRHGNL